MRDGNTNIHYYNVADIYISIQGEGEYADALRDYFRTEEDKDLGKLVSLSIIVSNNSEEVLIPAKFYSLSGAISFNDSAYCVKKKNFIYSVSNMFNDEGPVVLRLCCTRKKSIKYALKRFLRHNVGINSAKDEFVDSVMNYGMFWYIFALILMKQKKVFIHSAMIERNGKALVLAGTGGCGKTSTLFKFMEDERIKYLAEDFGIMSCDGYVYYLPKKMAIYESDARYRSPIVVQALKKLSFLQKIHWKLLVLIGLNPRFRFAPDQVFDSDKIAKKAETEKVIFLSRAHGTEITKSEISQAELCTKIRHAAFRELRELGEILNNIRAVGDETTRKAYPEMSQIEAEYEQLLFGMLSDKRTRMMLVPLKAIPGDIVNHILGEYF